MRTDDFQAQKAQHTETACRFFNTQCQQLACWSLLIKTGGARGIAACHTNL